MKTNSNNIESKNGVKNNPVVDYMRKLTADMMGKTLVWQGCSNQEGEYLLKSFTKVSKTKAEVWLKEKSCGHIITMDLSRKTLEDLQRDGEHRMEYGTAIRVKQDAKKPLWIMFCNSQASDIFKSWSEAVGELRRHVYDTLQDCCRGKVCRESESRYQVYFKERDKWEVFEVVPFDPRKPKHREAYEAQCDRLGLPTLQQPSVITGIKAVCIEGVRLTAEKRAKWTKNFSDVIRDKATENVTAQYNHSDGCICVRVAYRNGSDNPDDMTYCVCWYKWLDVVAETMELVDCENGIRLEQAARHMADFHLLSEAGLTVRQILYPAA